MPRKKLKRKFRKVSKRLKVLGRQGYLFVVFGLLLISTSLVWRHYRIRILSFEGYPLEVSEEINSPPAVQITIPKIGLELPVFEGSIKDGVWETTEEGAIHLDKSADPGQNGNVVIYGHNTNLLFGPIRWLSVGDEIELVDVNKQIYKYQIVEVIETTPEDIRYVLPKDEETLTLYTCTGFLDSKRHIIIAKPHVEN